MLMHSLDREHKMKAQWKAISPKVVCGFRWHSSIWDLQRTRSNKIYFVSIESWCPTTLHYTTRRHNPEDLEL